MAKRTRPDKGSPPHGESQSRFPRTGPTTLLPTHWLKDEPQGLAYTGHRLRRRPTRQVATLLAQSGKPPWKTALPRKSPQNDDSFFDFFSFINIFFVQPKAAATISLIIQLARWKKRTPQLDFFFQKTKNVDTRNLDLYLANFCPAHPIGSLGWLATEALIEGGEN